MGKPTPWSVKGIGPEARETAKAAAHGAGMTLGAWMTQMIEAAAAEKAAEPPAPPADTASHNDSDDAPTNTAPPRDDAERHSALAVQAAAVLARRVKAMEAEADARDSVLSTLEARCAAAETRAARAETAAADLAQRLLAAPVLETRPAEIIEADAAAANEAALALQHEPEPINPAETEAPAAPDGDIWTRAFGAESDDREDQEDQNDHDDEDGPGAQNPEQSETLNRAGAPEDAVDVAPASRLAALPEAARFRDMVVSAAMPHGAAAYDDDDEAADDDAADGDPASAPKGAQQDAHPLDRMMTPVGHDDAGEEDGADPFAPETDESAYKHRATVSSSAPQPTGAAFAETSFSEPAWTAAAATPTTTTPPATATMTGLAEAASDDAASEASQRWRATTARLAAEALAAEETDAFPATSGIAAAPVAAPDHDPAPQIGAMISASLADADASAAAPAAEADDRAAADNEPEDGLLVAAPTAADNRFDVDIQPLDVASVRDRLSGGRHERPLAARSAALTSSIGKIRNILSTGPETESAGAAETPPPTAGDAPSEAADAAQALHEEPALSAADADARHAAEIGPDLSAATGAAFDANATLAGALETPAAPALDPQSETQSEPQPELRGPVWSVESDRLDDKISRLVDEALAGAAPPRGLRDAQPVLELGDAAKVSEAETLDQPERLAVGDADMPPWLAGSQGSDLSADADRRWSRNAAAPSSAGALWVGSLVLFVLSVGAIAAFSLR